MMIASWDFFYGKAFKAAVTLLNSYFFIYLF